MEQNGSPAPGRKFGKFFGMALAVAVFVAGFVVGDLTTSRHAAQATVAYGKLKLFGDVLSVVQNSYV
jgi:hypothetical protein